VEKLFNNLSKPAAVYVAVLAAVSLYFIAVARQAVDFPFQDDYDAVLGTILYMKASDTSVEKIKIVLAQHNEHRIAFFRIVAFLLFKLQERVDFRVLIWVGNLGLVALCAAVMLGARKTVPCLHFLAIVPLLIFSPLQGSQMIWAMASNGNYWVLAFAAWSLLLLTRDGKKAFCGACLLAVVATFTSGQGIFCFLAGMAALFLQRRWRKILVWSGVFVLTGFIYFKGYYRPQELPMEFSLRSFVFLPILTGGAESRSLLDWLRPIASMLGIGNGRYPVVFQAMLGLGVLGLIGYVWLKRYYRRNLYVSVLLLYLMMLCAAATLARTSLGFEAADASRYYIISLLIALGLVLALMDMRCAKPQGDSVKVLVLMGTAFLNLMLWDIHFQEVSGLTSKIIQSRQLFMESQDPQAVLYPIKERATDQLWQSYLMGLLPRKDIDFSRPVLLTPARLGRISTVESAEQAKDLDPKVEGAARIVANLEWRGNDLELHPAEEPNQVSKTSGWIAVRNGKLLSFFPAHLQ